MHMCLIERTKKRRKYMRFSDFKYKNCFSGNEENGRSRKPNFIHFIEPLMFVKLKLKKNFTKKFY